MSPQVKTNTARLLLHAFAGENPATLPETDFVPKTVHLSRRELSLIIERLVMAAGGDQGVWPGARDYVLETLSQTDASALALLEEALIKLTGTDWPRPILTAQGLLDVQNAPAILVGNAIANAMLAHFIDAVGDPFVVTGLSDLRGLEGLSVRAAYHGFEIQITETQEAGTAEITARRAAVDPKADVVLLLQEGISVSGDQWWRLYRPSNFALSEETEVSRTHTGVSETLLHYAV